jgi:hypothetical protein
MPISPRLFALSLALGTLCPAALTQSTTAVPPTYTNGGYYRPVAPRPQTGPPCGHYGTKPCPHALEPIPPNATADQLYDMALNYDKQHNNENAMAFLQRSAELGNLHAESSYGFDLIYGTPVTAKNIPLGISYLEKSAAGGNRSAQFKLGSLYDDGEVVPHNAALAMKYMTLSANQSYWVAEEWVALKYEIGNGVPRSRATAIRMLNKAAGDGNAQVPLRIAGYLSHPSTPRFANEADLAAAYQAQISKEYNKFYPGVGGVGGVKFGPCSNGSSSTRAEMSGGCPAGFDTHGGMDSR